MASLDLHLYIDKQARQLVKGPQNKSPFTFSNFFQGDTLNLYLHGVTPSTDDDSLDVYEDDPITFTGIKCGIGPGADIIPTAGTFKIRLVGQTETTEAFDCGVDQATVLAALNNLASVKAVSAAGLRLDVTVPQATNFFLIRWVDPTITALFEIVENYLEPLSDSRSSVVVLSRGQIQTLKYFVLPYSFTDAFTYPSAAAATTDSVRVGTSTQNCVQSLTVPADAMGSFSLTFASNSTSLIAVADVQGSTDGSSEIATALNALYADGQTRFSVNRDATGVYYIELVGPLAKADSPVMDVTMHGQEPLDTPEGSLPLNGADLELALHGQTKLSLLFELEITDGADVMTIQQVVTVVNDMIDGAMSLVSNPPWQTPGSPSYPPNSGSGQTIVAPGAYVQPIGTASGVTSPDVVITHNLGTLDVFVSVRETGTPFLRLPDSAYTCTILNTNQVQVTFPTAPTSPLQYYVDIAACVPAERAFPDIDITIDQVEGLRAILNALQNAVNPDAPIDATQLPAKIPWYVYDANGKPTGFRFDVIPDGLIPANIPRLGADGTLPPSTMPPGVPVYTAGPPPTITVTVGNPPQTITLLQGDNSNPPNWSLPVSILPDPTKWSGLQAAIIAALQAGAPLPKGYVPMYVATLNKTFPAPVVLRDNTAAVPASLPCAWTNYTDAGSITGPLPLPRIDLAGTFYTVSDGASSLPARWRPAQIFSDGQTVLCDGYQWFEVRVEGNTAYPVEMEIELFTLNVSSVMLRNNSRFACSTELDISLGGPCEATTRARYILRVEVGTVNGPDIHDITWAAPVVALPLVLGSATVGHSVGFAVQKSIAGVLSATATLYGNDSVATPPTGSDFVVRASLVCFDVENSVNDTDAAPVGQVTVALKNPVASVSPLSTTSTAPVGTGNVFNFSLSLPGNVTQGRVFGIYQVPVDTVINQVLLDVEGPDAAAGVTVELVDANGTAYGPDYTITAPAGAATASSTFGGNTLSLAAGAIVRAKVSGYTASTDPSAPAAFLTVQLIGRQ